MLPIAQQEYNEASQRCWYAVFCKPRQEAVAQENLVRQGYQVYLPRIQLERRRQGRWVNAVEVMFPRYLFMRVDATQHSLAPVRSTLGVVGLVRFGAQPVVVADTVVEALKQRADAETGLHHDVKPLFRAGAKVRLVDGPLAGMEGIFTEEDGEKRAIILLELLGKAHKVKVARDAVALTA